MAAMTSKFNFKCVIQYYTDQWYSFFHYLKRQRNIRLFDGSSFPTKGLRSKRQIFIVVSGRERTYTFRVN